MVDLYRMYIAPPKSALFLLNVTSELPSNRMVELYTTYRAPPLLKTVLLANATTEFPLNVTLQ